MIYTIKYAILRYIRLTLSAITDTIQEQPVNFSIHFIWGREVVLWCICIIVKVVKEYICSTATNKLVRNAAWKSVSWRSLTWIMWPWIRKHDSSSAIAAQMTSNYKHWALHIVCTNIVNGTRNYRHNYHRPRLSPIHWLTEWHETKREWVLYVLTPITPLLQAVIQRAFRKLTGFGNALSYLFP